MDKLMGNPRELLLNLISEEKEKYGEYSQLCAYYQVQPDKQATAKHLGALEILQKLIADKVITKI